MFDYVQCPGCIGTGLRACDQCSGWSTGCCVQCGGSNAMRCGHCSGLRRVNGATALIAARPNFVERHGNRFFAGTLLAATATALLLSTHPHF